MAKKKFDPLWEIVDERVALQDQEAEVDVPCPYCHVRLHLGQAVRAGDRVRCGLCGGTSEVSGGSAGLHLGPAD